MACLTRNTRKLLNTAYACVGRTTKQTQSNNRRTLTTTNFNPFFRNSPITHKPFVITPLHLNLAPQPCTSTLRCRHIHSDGDKDLAKFLGKEIQIEEVKMDPDWPKLENGWKVVSLAERTIVTLQRVQYDEKVQIVFNIKDNVKVEGDNDGGDLLVNFMSNIDGYEDYEDPENMDSLLQDFIDDQEHSTPVRYPEFDVEITKLLGNTLRFNCSLNTKIDEDYNLCDRIITDYQDENFLLFDEIQVYNSGEVDHVMGDVPTNAYIGRFDTGRGRRRGELQAMLMNTLLERGIDGAFINSLVELASAIEHRHYIEFMKSLNKYASEE